MSAYYNENDPFAAAWLRELIKAGLIADGEVDTRSILDVRADDLRGFTQCHFFAGIGGWSYALRLAGWPDDREVWTGSCPCQPFSVGGKGEGFADERHLWPGWYWLIEQRRPRVVFGEQVESPLGRAWLDLVSTDLEAAHYACAAADLPVAGVGGPHIRQRLVWVADCESDHRRSEQQSCSTRSGRPGSPRGGTPRRMADDDGERLSSQRRSSVPENINAPRGNDADRCSEVLGLEHGIVTRLERLSGDGDYCLESRRLNADAVRSIAETGATRGTWSAADWILCRDNTIRPIEPGTFPLAHGIPARVGRLRGYGNAIVPQVAQLFIEAYCEARGLDHGTR